jgi:hypothetical protein
MRVIAANQPPAVGIEQAKRVVHAMRFCLGWGNAHGADLDPIAATDLEDRTVQVQKPLQGTVFLHFRLIIG